MKMDRMEQTARFTREGLELLEKDRAELRLKLKEQFFGRVKLKGIVAADFLRYLNQLSPADRAKLIESVVKEGWRKCPAELNQTRFEFNGAVFYVLAGHLLETK